MENAMKFRNHYNIISNEYHGLYNYIDLLNTLKRTAVIMNHVQGGPKNDPTYFCQNFIKSPPNLIIFGTWIAKTMKFCKVYSLSFNTVVCWHKLEDTDNKCTSHNSIVLAINVPETIKFGGDLTKFWQKQVGSFFGPPCIISNGCH